jgi:DNA-binding NarL/FixJ family response regulator
MIGRDAETALVSSLVGGLSEGRPFVLTVRGEPGSGRSSLLEAGRAAATAAGARVLVTRGIDGPTEPAFGGLSSLLRPLSPSLDDLAGDLAGVLRDALGLSREVDSTDVCRGLLRALAAVAERQPLLLLLDDADRIDEASVSALTFVLGRFGIDPIGAIAATGPGEGPLDAVTTCVLPLPALSRGALAQIVAEAVPCTPAVVETVASWADGSPLVALELARSLTADERDGSVALPEVPRPTVLVVDRLQKELEGLPADVQRALVVVAADRTGRVGAITSALATLGEPVGALDRAEAAGVIVVEGESVRFRHALLEPLAYRLVAAPSRRAAHRALAASLVEPRQAAERAWQLVASCAGPDEEVAATLELVADAERRRGAPAAAAVALEQAARLSIDAASRTRRLVDAATAHRDALDLDAARRIALDVVAGGEHLSVEMAAALASVTAVGGPVDALTRVLSAAELRVAEAVASGLTNRQAADQLFLSAKTVDFHLQAIYRKLAIRSRAELATAVARRTS